MFKSVQLQNFLSFGNIRSDLELHPLNIIIGANGSGKSNFLEAFDLLRNSASDITKPIRAGGGVSDWLYKGGKENENAIVNVEIKNNLEEAKSDFRYILEFNKTGTQFEIIDERIESDEPSPHENNPYIFYDFRKGSPLINVNNEKKKRSLERKDIDITQSILAQKHDTIHYPEISFLAQEFSKIKLYREWAFGRHTLAREPQKVDVKNDYLEPDGSNLCVVLNQLRNNLSVKKKLLKEMQDFFSDVEDYEITFAGGLAQLFFQERGLKHSVPATRLSDGTLRYLCLLSILCHPSPPPVVCIEEPELGLHPDVIPNIAKLLREASERCQLIITTHSEALVDLFTDSPDSIIISEKEENGTLLKRLDKNELKPWLEKYSLGKLWSRGDIGGTRW